MFLSLRLGIFCSHGGSNMAAIAAACAAGALHAEPRVVIGNNSRAPARQRAEAAGLPWRHLSGATHPDPDALDAAILATLLEFEVNLVVLAGYMKRLGPRTLAHFGGRILNIHPALLPAYGGQGMYGERVHAAVLAAGERETGVTVHLVTEQYDQGPIVAQCRLPVQPGDTAEALAARVLACEHRFYAATLERIAAGEIALPGLADHHTSEVPHAHFS